MLQHRASAERQEAQTQQQNTQPRTEAEAVVPQRHGCRPGKPKELESRRSHMAAPSKASSQSTALPDWTPAGGGGGQELRPRACLTQSSASLRRARYKTAVLPTSFRYTKGLLQRVAVVLTRSESVSAPGGPHWLQVELLPEDPVPVPTCLPWFPMWSRTGELALSLRSSV